MDNNKIFYSIEHAACDKNIKYFNCSPTSITAPSFLASFLVFLLSVQSACRGRGEEVEPRKTAYALKFLCAFSKCILQPCRYTSIIKLLTLFMHTWENLFSNLQPHIQRVYYAIVLTLFILNMQNNVYTTYLFKYTCASASS